MRIALLLGLVACGEPVVSDALNSDPFARVENVAVTGEAGAYSFAVTLFTDETGCDRYADWWEVLTPDGRLVYRRVLGHSHVDEQPFTRSGSPMDTQPDEDLIVRAHLHPLGYTGQAMQGSVAGGFAETSLDAIFAQEVAAMEPQPDGCAF